MYNSILS